jgi:hypothetical protein
MEICTSNKNRNSIRGYPNQKHVGLTKRTGKIQKHGFYTTVINPQTKFGRTDDEILNSIIAELHSSIHKSNFNKLSKP